VCATRIKLTAAQCEYADSAGKRRHEFNRDIGAKDAYGFHGDGLKINLEGTRAELAVAVALQVEWIDFSEDYHSIVADVGSCYQVRSTTHQRGNLILHPKDRDDQVFILVRSHRYPDMEICGWVYGRDAKQKKYWVDGKYHPSFSGRECYLYPASELNPMKTLPREVEDDGRESCSDSREANTSQANY